ncbi:hypothetical protein CcaverHIS002_0400610 [Cutaneotrichosporon cavernicola]|nr:hypothetical protein CcaverHIS002_0400610 [Cutaneotrichosporon cavernicola]
MSLLAQAIVPEHATVPMLPTPPSKEPAPESILIASKPDPVSANWWAELARCDGVACAVQPHPGESPRRASVDIAPRSAARLCRRVAEHTDAALYADLTVNTTGFHCANGKLPLINLWRRPDVAGAVRTLTIADEWDDWTVLADVFPGLAPDQPRPTGFVCTNSPSPSPRGDDIDDLAGPTRLIYTVRHGDPDLLLVAVPENWSLPDSVQNLVIHIGPHPAPHPAPMPEIFDRAHIDDGAHTYLKHVNSIRRSSDYGLTSSPLTTIKGVEWLHAAKGHPCFLDRLASVIAANLRPGRMFTLVGPEAWDERWLCSTPGQRTITYRFFYTVVRHARRHHRWNGKFAERAVAEAIRLISEDEYRAEVGEETWRLETVLE